MLGDLKKSTYRRQNAFLYIDNGSSLNFDLEKIVFADKEVKRHRCKYFNPRLEENYSLIKNHQLFGLGKWGWSAAWTLKVF